ncbi:MAG: aspartyl protease family protein [Gammaproteobacteria bacterium]|nr:aspartyl protease family protein [Gammaproteobacteria bacterium]
MKKISTVKAIILMFFPILLLFNISCLYADAGSRQNNSQQFDPYTILQSHYDAVGGLERLKKQKSSYTSGKITFAEMDGVFKQWSQGIISYRREEHYPAFSQYEGDSGEQMWSVDLNHKLLVLKDPETKKRRKIRGLLNKYENINKDSQYFKLKYNGIKDVNGEKCHVIETLNTINKDVYYSFISVESFFLLKQIIKQPYLEISTVYSDFRKINDIVYSFRNEIDISPTGKKIITQINEILVDLSINPQKFEIPNNDVKDFKFENNINAEAIPFLLVENNIYLPVTINGEEHYWVLDSGADMSVIDAAYADILGLIPQGRLLGNATSSLVEFTFVNLGGYQIKGLELFDQTILAYKGLAENFFEPEAVGILGYDFLSRFITKVDFSKQQVSFYNPDSFVYKGKGERINAPLQNKLFMVSMSINDTYQGRFGLDLGSFNVSMNYRFAEKHKLLQEIGIIRLSSDIAGVFQELQIKSESMEIAGHRVKNELYSFPLKKGNGTNSDGEMDGLVGNSLLRHFVLYLDYKHQQLIFEKGDDFNFDFPNDKSGMIIGQSLDKMPEVFYVAENTPAHKAGILSEDIIVAINNLEGATLPDVVQIAKMLQADSGTEYQMKLLRNKQYIMTSLKLQDLYK